MNSLRTVLLAASLPFFVAACSNQPMPTQAAASPEPMTAGAEPNTMRYINPNADLRRYTSFEIDPVTIYDGPDAQFGNATPADKQQIADFMQSEFTRTLSQHYSVVSSSGPNTLRIHLTLAGLELTRPALATVSHLAPAGLALNVIKGGTGGQGTFMGSVTIAGDFYDSMTNDLVGSVLTVQHPNALDITSVVSGLGAAKAGVSDAAEKFADAIDKIQATGQAPAARR